MLSASLLVTIIAMILVLALGIGFWARSRRARPLVGAIGTALIPLGLFLLGITDLTINGIMSLVRWVQGVQWDTTMTIGASLAGGGLLLAVIALFLPKEPKAATPNQPQPARRPVAGQQQPAVGAQKPQSGEAASKGGQKPASAQKTGKDGLTDEDRDVAELLKQRGIM